MKFFIVLIIAAASTAWALPTEDGTLSTARGFAQNSVSGEDSLFTSLYSGCGKGPLTKCLKLKIVSFMDQVAAQDSYLLMDGISVVRTEDQQQQPNGEGAPRAATDDSVTGRLQSFLNTHTLKIDLKGSDVVNAVSSAGRAFGEVTDTLMGSSSELTEETARGKVKKAGKLLGPLLLGILMKAAILAPLALGAIALIAGKALLVGKIALLLSAVIGLKKLLSGQQKTVTYEVVSHPHYSHSNGGGSDSYSAGSSGGSYASSGSGSSSGGWGRSVDVKPVAATNNGPWDAQQLAYRGQQ
ncbi:hypothetical protein B566_EDAN009218 [Ephemera danica]|nr:hypothetical protein B566_EDAN009218 [Ephemera danica]